MKLYRVSAFLKTEFGGNKAGVCINADALSDKEMQQIAHDVGYSETAFVLKSDIADFKVRFFSPISEVDLCGHATIATFNLLRDLNIIKEGLYTQETKVGVLALKVQKETVFMEQNNPVFDEDIDESEISLIFNNKHFIHETLPIKVVSTGLREIFLPIQSIEALNELNPNFEEMIELCIKYQVIGIHAFSLSEDVDAYGRNFAPMVGINEESATGTSNGALGCYLHKFHHQKSKCVLRQGYSMNAPSEIVTELELNNKTITKVWVGGTAKAIKK